MKRRALLAGIAATALVASLSGCTLASALTPPVESQLYATKADASGPNATISIPSFVPDDAVMIRIKQNAETGDAILKWDDPAPEDMGAACDPPATDVTAPLDDTWWPQQISPDSVACIDNWHVSRIGSSFFAWEYGSPAA
ncbi:MAG: hypothetical protein EPO52_11790 [Herbiconiux sp.]|uniref:hypothetical protein n=1 Tax=Herbiconiux sp. TaxID=1871186 RepID=UPI001219806B|nr:hypothetical protein [Herbiconiux sp.]TAJ47543.1 MAG: hypothetical protein EPO52_11790 [Herbiconiux sp.]